MDAHECNEIPANGGEIRSDGQNVTTQATDPTVSHTIRCANDADSNTTCRSTGGSKKSRKLNKLFQFPNVLKKLNDYNLFPHKIKAISDDPNVHNRKSSAHSDRLAHLDLSDTMDSSMELTSSGNPISSPAIDALNERSAKRNSIRKSISNSIRKSMRSAKKSSAKSLEKLTAKSSEKSATKTSTRHPVRVPDSTQTTFPSNPADHRPDNDCSPGSSADSSGQAFDNSFHESPGNRSAASDRSLDPSYRKSPLLRLLAAIGLPSHATHSTPLNRLIFLSAILFILLLSFLTDLVYCDHINLPPRFVTLPGYSSDIVLTIKEGNSSLNKEIYRLAGEDPNEGDRLRFGVIGPIGNDILRIENDVPTLNQATIYLKKELDRETQPSYSLVLTLTDGKLAKGSYVSKRT